MIKGLWQRHLWDKYIGNSTFGQIQKKQGDSHFWRGLLKCKDLFLTFCRFCVGNGKKTRFGEDKLIGKESLSSTFPSLYNISQNLHITLCDALSSGLDNLKFHRALVASKVVQWQKS